MNISFNQRYYSTEEKIQKALFSLLEFKKYDDIAIKEICYEAGINRSSFYAHYQDINDLMIKTENSLSKHMAEIFKPTKIWNEQVFVEMFNFLLENKNFYKAYLDTSNQPIMEKNDFLSYLKIVDKFNKNLNFDNAERNYHMAFFAGGLKALCKSWIKTGCKETPEQMAKIITNEYKVNSKFFS